MGSVCIASASESRFRRRAARDHVQPAADTATSRTSEDGLGEREQMERPGIAVRTVRVRVSASDGDERRGRG